MRNLITPLSNQVDDLMTQFATFLQPNPMIAQEFVNLSQFYINEIALYNIKFSNPNYIPSGGEIYLARRLLTRIVNRLQLLLNLIENSNLRRRRLARKLDYARSNKLNHAFLNK